MSFGAAVFVEQLSLDAKVVESFAKKLDVDQLGIELEFEWWEHAKAGVTALLVEHSDFDPSASVKALAPAFARKLKRQTWALEAMANADWWLWVTAFDEKGKPRWSQDLDSVADKKIVNEVLRRFGTPKLKILADEAPYWRMASEWKAHPRKPVMELGLEPVLQLGYVKGWRRVSMFPLRFSAQKRAELAEAAKRTAEEQAALEAQRAHAVVEARRLHAEREAARRADAAAEARRLMSRELVPGTARSVEMPSTMQRMADGLAKKYAVSPAWVWQAAVAHSTPWKFPSSALAVVPLVNPAPVELIVSPALAVALEKSSLTRPDGTPASFDELVRIAASLGLDGLADDLRDDEKKRKKLARK